MQWWTRNGPFWEAEGDRRHDADEWFECRGTVVTDDALGEAAYRATLGLECEMVSFAPSEWNPSPLVVHWKREERLEDLRIGNSRKASELRARLESSAPPISSWKQLADAAGSGFSNLRFGPECFRPLRRLPFSRPAATRIRALLDILDRLSVAFLPDGKRSREGHRLYQKYFTGDCAPFSDSSGSEKKAFAKDLQFDNPERPGEVLWCFWHGKIRRMTLRIHFSWPEPGKPLYVMYIGQKITRR